LRPFPIDDGIKQTLQGQTTEMKSDKFWRDMAKPIDASLRAMKDEMEAMDTVSAKEYRKQATKHMEDALVELEKAATSQMQMWAPAFEAGQKALDQLRRDPQSAPPKAAPAPTPPPAAPSSPAAPATGAANAATAPPTATTVATTRPPPAFDEAKARAEPYKWEQDEDSAVYVHVPVPDDCKKSDVTVVFGPQRLKVAVKGHPLDPIIDGPLLYGVRMDECSWGLEGSGAKRKLAITLEKVQPELSWADLLDSETGRKQKAISELAHGIEGMGPLKKYGEA